MAPQATDNHDTDQRVIATVRQLQRIRANLAANSNAHPFLHTVLEKLEADLAVATATIEGVADLADQLEDVSEQGPLVFIDDTDYGEPEQ